MALVVTRQLSASLLNTYTSINAPKHKHIHSHSRTLFSRTYVYTRTLSHFLSLFLSFSFLFLTLDPLTNFGSDILEQHGARSLRGSKLFNKTKVSATLS